jgi:hypothetical protein
MDHDLREYQQEITLSSVSAQDMSKKLAPLKTKSTGRKSKAIPLFEPEEEEISPVQNDDIGSDDGEELAIAIQASMDSGPTVASHSPLIPNATRSSPLSFHGALNSDSMFQVSTLLQTALSIANAGPSPRLVSPSRRRSSLPLYNLSSIFLQRIFDPPPLVSAQNISDSDGSLQQIPVRSTAASVILSEPISDASFDKDMAESSRPLIQATHLKSKVVTPQVQNQVFHPHSTATLLDHPYVQPMTSSRISCHRLIFCISCLPLLHLNSSKTMMPGRQMLPNFLRQCLIMKWSLKCNPSCNPPLPCLNH